MEADGIRYKKPGLIICGYPGVGKSSVAGWSNCIDLESSFFSYRGGAPQRLIYWVPQYCDMASNLALQGFTVMTSTHEAVIECFKNLIQEPGNNDYKNLKDRIVIFCPNSYWKDEWIKRLRKRLDPPVDQDYMKNIRALNRAEGYFEKDIEYLNNCGFPVYHPESLDYDLRDYIYQIRETRCYDSNEKTDSQV